MVFLILSLIFGFPALLFWLIRSGDRSRKQPKRHNAKPYKPRVSYAKGHPKPFQAEKSHRKIGFIRGRAYVVDGDTITIEKTQIRLFGIDAPEMNHPFGVKAKWALVNLCKGRQVSAAITAQDAYGRTVAKCTLEDGSDLSAEMVKLGLAIDWPKFSGGCYKHLEQPDARRKLWLADARQKGRMDVWKRFDDQQGK